MEFKFGVIDILQIAERLEHNGKYFYTKMAKLFVVDTRRWNLCQDLADWRAGRELTLAKQRKRFHGQESRLKPIKDWRAGRELAFVEQRIQFLEQESRPKTIDISDYFQIHPDVMADLAVFSSKLYPSHMPTGKESPSQIIKDAIARTEEAITFYRGLKDFARNQEAQAVINQIIEEEKHHISVLVDILNSINISQYTPKATITEN
ncbi:MAG: hypothetical protein ACYSUX_16370 [Planctomycetota bacterium]|jgi:rubrerythrin